MKLKIGDIKPNPNNPRFIKDDNYKKLVKSLKDFPEMLEAREIVVNKDHVILGGNMRYKAAVEAGYKEVPVKIVDWPKDKQQEFIIKDNVSGGEWDWDLLANEWDAQLLDDWGLELPGDFGSNDEIEEDEAPEISNEPPVSQLGVVYQLGRHRVMCGDSTDREQVKTLMNGNKADMVFTDPPYGVDYSGGIQFTKDGVKKDQRERLIDDHADTDIYSRVVPIIPEFTNGAVYMWFADTQALPVYQAVERVGDIHALIIWVKNGGYSAMNANYKQKHEPCLYWKPKNGKLNFIGKSTETTIWDLDKDGKNEYHPTQKPVALSAKAIQNHDSKTALDLFLGSGSTLIACEQTDRTCYGMELDPKYVDVIRKRYCKYINGGELPDNWQELTPAVV